MTTKLRLSIASVVLPRWARASLEAVVVVGALTERALDDARPAPALLRLRIADRMGSRLAQERAGGWFRGHTLARVRRRIHARLLSRNAQDERTGIGGLHRYAVTLFLNRVPHDVGVHGARDGDALRRKARAFGRRRDTVRVLRFGVSRLELVSHRRLLDADASARSGNVIRRSPGSATDEGARRYLGLRIFRVYQWVGNFFGLCRALDLGRGTCGIFVGAAPSRE